MIVNDQLKATYFSFLDKKDCKTTIESAKFAVNQFLCFLETLAISITKINHNTLNQYVASLKDEKNYASKTIHQKVSHVKMFLRYAFDEKFIDTHVDRLITLQVKMLLPKIETKVHIELEEDEIEYLIQNCKNKHKALLLILYNSMGRVSAIEKIKIYDIDFEKSILIIYEDKVKTELAIELSERTIFAIQEYIEKYRKEAKEEYREFLFITKFGNNLKARSIQTIVSSYRHLVGNKKITPHSFRGIGITHMLNNGASLQEVASIVGHANISTTMIYYIQSRKRRAETFKRTHPLLKEKHLKEKEKNIEEKELKIDRAKDRFSKELQKLQQELNEL